MHTSTHHLVSQASAAGLNRSCTRLMGLVMVLALVTGCALRPTPAASAAPDAPPDPVLAARLDAWLPADVLLLGEQHDAPDHQQVQQQVVAALAMRGQLAALVLEMADSGRGTAALPADASPAQAREALGWDEAAWPWAAYGPVVMRAVRDGVPVLGGNLPRPEMRARMADAALDQRLPGPALKAQQQLIRQGHCGLLPESQITPMTRIQIAKDLRLASTVGQAVSAGRVVLLITGSVHADLALGVPQHLPPTLRVKAILLRAGPPTSDEGAPRFDEVWPTPAVPQTDDCARLRERWGAPASAKP